jgi:FkbM family methyltransferase
MMPHDGETGLSLRVEGHGSVPSGVARYLGRPFVYPRDHILGAHIAAGHEWDEIFRITLPALLPRAEPSLCEVGSNIGASLLQILSAKPQARVIALEPCNLFRAYLERNLELAGRAGVEIIPLLAGAENKPAHLHHDMSSGTPREAGHLPHCQPAPMTKLDTLLGPRPGIDLLKVDTDGFDFEVLRGAEAILRRDRPILHFEFAPALMQTDPAGDLNWLRTLGYERLACLHPAGLLLEVTEDPAALLRWADQFTYCDLLACPAGSDAERRFEQLVRQHGLRTWDEPQRRVSVGSRLKRRLSRWIALGRSALQPSGDSAS